MGSRKQDLFKFIQMELCCAKGFSVQETEDFTGGSFYRNLNTDQMQSVYRQIKKSNSRSTIMKILTGGV